MRMVGAALRRNSVQADFDGSPMVTDLMADETALAFARVLGERNEAYPDDLPAGGHRIRGDLQHMPRNIMKTWPWRVAGDSLQRQ